MIELILTFLVGLFSICLFANILVIFACVVDAVICAQNGFISVLEDDIKVAYGSIEDFMKAFIESLWLLLVGFCYSVIALFVIGVILMFGYGAGLMVLKIF